MERPVASLAPAPASCVLAAAPSEPTEGDGLSRDEAARLLIAHGANEIARARGRSVLRALAAQFSSPLIWLLLGACAASAALDETLDAAAIAVVVVVNALIGFAQEQRAERAMEALRAMSAPRARVVRDGRVAIIDAKNIVPGDVLVLDAGDIVAADARLVSAHALSTNEAALTGESVPVDKRADAAPAGAPLAERWDSVFMGTSVATGSARARVIATGPKTELGRIAAWMAATEPERTPLERQLERVGRSLLIACLSVVGVVALLSLIRGESWLVVLLTSVSLAVAAVPEGLPAIVTIALAIGVQRMAARNVLVRRLPAVETLGCTTVICTDKTGTLTTGRMRVREIWSDTHSRSVVLDAAAACSDAELDAAERDGVGDPTEVAILLAAAEQGVRRASIERERPRRAVHPFDSERKRMSIARADGRLYVKGAPESVFGALTNGDHTHAGAVNTEMAARGLRVLAVAMGRGAEERDLELVGLLGLADPPRKEAIGAIADAHRAGIRTVMITGDHLLTARAIARELGLVGEGESSEERVHARATPEDKLRIVRAWKARGEIVAMTGDGVNDAPALREASIGIAMGKSGTDVAREAAAMILTDDDFTSIVAAIREGRGVFENIRKTLVYLLSGNVAELVFVLATSLLGMPFPLTALQILWVNLATDGLPALALAIDPAPHDVLDRPPRPPSQPILGSREWRSVLAVALIEAAVVLATYAWALSARGLVEARDLAFSVLVFSEVLRSVSARSDTRVFFETRVLSNAWLLVVVAGTISLQILIQNLPFTQTLFGIAPISAIDELLALGVALVPVSLIELTKLARRFATSSRMASTSPVRS
jgi:Ca2+-transporting ATPase